MYLDFFEKCHFSKNLLPISNFASVKFFINIKIKKTFNITQFYSYMITLLSEIALLGNEF